MNNTTRSTVSFFDFQRQTGCPPDRVLVYFFCVGRPGEAVWRGEPHGTPQPKDQNNRLLDQYIRYLEFLLQDTLLLGPVS